MNRRKEIIAVVSLVVALVSMPVTYGEIVLSNMYPDGTPNLRVLGRAVSYGAWQATPITTGSTSYSIQSITADIIDVTDTGDLFLQIWSSNLNSEVGTQLAELVLVSGTSAPKRFEPSLLTPLTLAANTSYFVVAGAPNGSGEWQEQVNATESFGPYFQADGIWRLGTLDGSNPLIEKTYTSSDAGSTWQSDSLLSAPLRLSIEAVPAGGPANVPEIDPSGFGAAVAFLSTCLALLERRRARAT